MEHASRAWSLALGAWLVAASTKAQTPPPFGTPSTSNEMAETMRTGLVPLFSAIGAGVLFMAVVATIAVIWLRRPLPPLDA